MGAALSLVLQVPCDVADRLDGRQAVEVAALVERGAGALAAGTGTNRSALARAEGDRLLTRCRLLDLQTELHALILEVWELEERDLGERPGTPPAALPDVSQRSSIALTPADRVLERCDALAPDEETADVLRELLCRGLGCESADAVDETRLVGRLHAALASSSSLTFELFTGRRVRDWLELRAAGLRGGIELAGRRTPPA